MIATLPVGEKLKTGHADMNNERISSLNTEIEALTKIYSNTVYVNIGGMLKDNAGYLHSEYHVGDGIHLSNKGYEIYINSLKDTLATI